MSRASPCPLPLKAVAVLLAMGALFYCVPARAAPTVVDVPSALTSMRLADHLDVALSPVGLGLADARTGVVAERFRPNAQERVRLGTIPLSTVWLRARLRNTADGPRRWVVVVGHSHAPARAWVVPVSRDGGGPEGPIRELRYDVLAPFWTRPLTFRSPAVPVDVGPGEEADLYVAVDAVLANFAVTLWDRDAFAAMDDESHLVAGITVGGLLTVVAFALFVFVSTRDPSFLYYCAYLVCLLGAQLTLSGHAFQHLWPAWPRWNRVSIDVFVHLCVVAHLFFTRAFLQTTRRLPWAERPIAVAAVAGILLAVVGALRPAGVEPFIVFASNAFAPMVGVLTTAVGVASLGKSPGAPYFVAGFASLFLGIAAFVGQNLGPLPKNVLTTYALQLGCVGEVFWFTLGLARRLQALAVELSLRVGQLEAQRVAIDQLNAELRRQVADRSRQLSDALARVATGAERAADLPVGHLVGGRYRVLGPIGEGAMGTVYVVERTDDLLRLALKVLSNVTGPIAMARFAREAQMAATVSHPNVVSVIDVGVADEGFLFLVMELVEGRTLDAVVERYRDVGWALDVLAEVSRGLAAIHAQGIVHRDLKPSNVLLHEREDGTLVVKISDFGIASAMAESASSLLVSTDAVRTGDDVREGTRTPSRGSAPPIASIVPPQRGDPSTTIDPLARTVIHSVPPSPGLDGVSLAPPAPVSGRVSSGDLNLTEAGALVGTPNYMAPELSQGSRDARPSVDLFSLGVIAYEILTGARPFRDSPALMRLRGSTLPPALSLHTACPALPEAVADVLDRCLSQHPQARPTAAEVEGALRGARVVRTARAAAVRGPAS